jgi:bifunctional UDP-N-acetylglucosamine pyrophosphorylase / glucosamine-1-phosphate N-acetyltransferase
MKKSYFSVIILAAGRGVRMASALPKVLHPVAGSPMVLRVLEQCRKAGAGEIRVVVGFGEALVRQVVEPAGGVCFRQVDQKGTGDAVRAAKPETLEGPVLILNGDHPLIEAEDIKKIVENFKETSEEITVITAKLKKPGSYGRIVRSGGNVRAIVEAKDASADTLKINEVNTGIYMLDAKLLHKLLPLVQNKNAQGEFYLTDIISLGMEHKIKVNGVVLNSRVATGVNSQIELSNATRRVYLRKAKQLLEAGVMIIDPKNTYIEDSVEVGASSVIYPGCFLKGRTKIGQFTVLEPNCFVNHAVIGDSVQVRAGSYLEECEIKEKAVLGPYARIRPETVIGREAHIGNFVELKKVVFGDRAKANHLTYLGDAEVGEGTNIGCGTITCNYAVDRKKYKTVIGKNVFVGSDSQFIAPVTIGDNAVIGSGSTITKDVPANALGVARAKQFVKENYVSVDGVGPSDSKKK